MTKPLPAEFDARVRVASYRARWAVDNWKYSEIKQWLAMVPKEDQEMLVEWLKITEKRMIQLTGYGIDRGK